MGEGVMVTLMESSMSDVVGVSEWESGMNLFKKGLENEHT